MQELYFPRTVLSRTKRVAAQLAFAATAVAASGATLAVPEHGVFRGDAPNGPSRVDEYSKWLGKPATVGTAFSPRATWSDIAGAGWNLQPWGQWVRAQSGRNISYHVSMLPASGASLSSCAAGQYDSHFETLANNLAMYGLHWAYLRVGAEMDGSWFPWNATRGSGKEASYAGCFRRIVTAMRRAQPANQWKFVFNPAQSFNGNKTYLESVWPGDAYVDVVGVDFYDQSWVADTYPYPSNCDSACRLTRQQKAWNANYPVLAAIRDFARTHGKPIAFPEWGVGSRPDGHGGGDNPFFIQKMYDFMMDPANNVAYHGHWDYPASDFNAQLSGSTSMPQSASLFKKLFSSTGSGTTNTPPSVSITSPASGQTLSGSVSYSANATDNVGVTRVDFAVDSTALVSDTSAPYGGTLDTTKLANGAHILKATAYDGQGLSTTTQITFNVDNGGGSVAGPTNVAFRAPAENGTLSGSYKDSSACEVTGTGITRVVFFMDSTQLNTETWEPWQCAFDTRQFADGTHTLRAVAYNAAGGSTSVSRTVKVQNGSTANTPPTVAITSPTAGQTVSGTVSYAANASDNAGVARVEFAIGATALLTDTSAPYGGSLDTTKLANGTHVLKATAFDAQGLSATSQVSINVQNALAGPTNVRFTAPAEGGTLSGAYRDSTACEVAGNGITRVVFLIDGKEVHTETWGPWQCTFDTRQYANGTHTLTAVAYDATGGSTTVTRTVNFQNGPGNVAFSAPAEGGTLSGSYRDSRACEVTGSGINRVVFFMNDTQLNTETWGPWQCAFDTRKFANGTHTLRAVAYDAAGGFTTVSRSVRVSN